MITPFTDHFETFDLINMLSGNQMREEWRPFWEKGWHINLERCEVDNDFEWVEENLEAEEFFIWWAKKVIFPMDNWKRWFCLSRIKMNF